MLKHSLGEQAYLSVNAILTNVSSRLKALRCVNAFFVSTQDAIERLKAKMDINMTRIKPLRVNRRIKAKQHEISPVLGRTKAKPSARKKRNSSLRGRK